MGAVLVEDRVFINVTRKPSPGRLGENIQPGKKTIAELDSWDEEGREIAEQIIRRFGRLYPSLF